jgi:ABC-type Fe3+ transport system substrate-binding protein
MTIARSIRESEGARRWFPLVKGLATLGVVLGVPFLLAPSDSVVQRSGETVVILTAHSEPFRYEFARGFREHMKKRGRTVSIDWRRPGSSRQISRIIVAEFVTSFERYWTTRVHRPWSSRIAAAFADPSLTLDSDPANDDDVHAARRAFLASDTGIGIDLLFGTGSTEAMAHASAGRLVDAGLVRTRPDLFGDRGIPQKAGGKVLWDAEGRWMGSCLTVFGICYNRDAIARLAVPKPPAQWSDLADPAYMGQLGIADPSKSGAAASAFEMVIHQQMNLREQELEKAGVASREEIETRARSEGWNRAMRLIRRIAANSRYFSSEGTQSALDVAMGDAAAGMCIDFYGRFQSEVAGGGAGRLEFVTPHGGTAVDSDPIALFRGAPHRELAIAFIDFVLSPDGQKLWNFRVGTPGGPERYALRRLPILPSLYDDVFDALRSDPQEKPYEEARAFTYHPKWTGPLFRTIIFALRVTCLDPQDELREAYASLVRAKFPPRAAALFDDVSAVDYAAALGPIRTALASGDPVDEARLGNRLVEETRAQYRQVSALARAGQ